MKSWLKVLESFCDSAMVGVGYQVEGVWEEGGREGGREG